MKNEVFSTHVIHDDFLNHFRGFVAHLKGPGSMVFERVCIVNFTNPSFCQFLSRSPKTLQLSNVFTHKSHFHAKPRICNLCSKSCHISCEHRKSKTMTDMHEIVVLLLVFGSWYLVFGIGYWVLGIGGWH